MKTLLPLVALIDDDRFHMHYYRRAVEEETGAQTKQFDGPLAFINALNSGVQFDLVITDVMMPANEVFGDDASDEGRLTGVLLVEAMREVGIDCPVIILSNLETSRLQWLKEHFAGDSITRIARKIDCDPFEVAKMVKDLLRQASGRPLLGDGWKRLLDSLQLRPNFMGLGIDLKELIKGRKQ